MFEDNANNEYLKALVGNVEWILSQVYFQEQFRLAFRVNGELRGLTIDRYAPMMYGTFEVKKVGPEQIVVKPMERNAVLAMVFVLDKSRLTGSEIAEWEAYCEKEARERERKEVEERERELKAKRQQLKTLKRELGEK